MPRRFCSSFAPLMLCVFALSLFGCELRFGAAPTATPVATTIPTPRLTVAWTEANGDLFAWREDERTPRRIASGGVIAPYLAPDGEQVAFTRGTQGDPVSLWAVGIDGTGAEELVTAGDIPAQRSGHAEIAQVAWLDDQTVYFNTRQRADSGAVNDDTLYRVALDAANPVPELILPSGAGGNFAIAPGGTAIAVISAGVYDTQKGRVSLLDPLGARVREALTFTAINTPDEAPFYPPLDWSADSAFVRIAIPDHDGDRVTLWRAASNGAAQIFGYVTATRDGLPVWSDGHMLYLQANPTGGFDLISADANGENAQVYASGAIERPRWLADGDYFVYALDGALWIGQRGDSPRPLNSAAEHMIVAGEWVITAQDGLRATSINGESVLITATATSFDAVRAP